MKFTLAIAALLLVCTQAAGLMGGYKQMDVQEALESPIFQSGLNFGLKEFVSQAVADNQLLSDEQIVIKVNSISTQVVNGLNIVYDVDIEDASGEVHNVNFTVYSLPRANVQRLTSYIVRH